MREGARSLSRDLAEMAQVYKFGSWRTSPAMVLLAGGGRARRLGPGVEDRAGG